MKIAIVHDYLNQYGGAERCLEQLHALFPSAPIYTLMYDKKVLPQYAAWDIRVSSLQRLPGMKRHYRYYIPFFPWLVKSLKVKDYDIVLSVSHAWVKAVKTYNAHHICYCLTPIRYAWDLYEDYKEHEYIPRAARLLLPFFAAWLRMWDKRQAERIDTFVAISTAVKERIKKYYGKESTIIYPPVDTDFFHPLYDNPREDFFVVVSRLKAYKRIDLIVDVCTQLKYPLKVVGSGPQLEKLKKRAGDNVEFLTGLTDEEVRGYYQRARAFIFAGHEDFGIVMGEAQACGTPVIAYGRGGALDLVSDGKTGLFFYEQTHSALRQAIETFNRMYFNDKEIREHALSFDRKHFKEKIQKLVDSLIED